MFRPVGNVTPHYYTIYGKEKISEVIAALLKSDATFLVDGNSDHVKIDVTSSRDRTTIEEAMVAFDDGIQWLRMSWWNKFVAILTADPIWLHHSSRPWQPMPEGGNS